MPHDRVQGPRPALPMPAPPSSPTREEILAHIWQQNSGHLIEQVINLEADKAVLTNELVVARRRIAELEQQLADVPEPATAEPA